jgi:N-methylhydantoinase B/oxoprolinase/acetone carboxylase alpha subunit
VLADVREGAVSREAAEREYGVVLEQRDPPSWVVDEAATARRRADMRAKLANTRASSPATAGGPVSSKT